MSMSSLLSDDGGGVSGFQIAVMTFAFLHMIIRGMQLVLDLITTFFIITPLVTGNRSAFEAYLISEGNHVVWKGPYPILSSENEEGFSANDTEIATVNGTLTSNLNATEMAIINGTVTSNLNATEMAIINGTDASAAVNKTGDLFEGSIVDVRTNIHLWSTHVLISIIIFVFAFVLIYSAKKKSAMGVLAWLSFSIPIFLKKLVQIALDLILGDYQQWLLKDQIVEGIDLGIQFVGVAIVICYFFKLRSKEAEMRQIHRYSDRNGFARNSGSITIRQIMDDEQF